jgi:hypothetical protein
MAWLLNAVSNAELTAKKSRTYDQVAAERRSPVLTELRLCAVAKATLGRGAFWVLFCRKKVPVKIYVLHLIDCKSYFYAIVESFFF